MSVHVNWSNEERMSVARECLSGCKNVSGRQWKACDKNSVVQLS